MWHFDETFNSFPEHLNIYYKRGSLKKITMFQSKANEIVECIED